MISLISYEPMAAAAKKIQSLEGAIHLIRGQRVMLDSDLAAFYGVTVRRLNEQLRRNAGRFPDDFAFQLARKEVANLKSQFATSSSHGGKRKLPWAFTEHGAIMLASVLNSETAVAASVRVVRAFVRLREMLLANRELAAKFSELELRLDGHDEAIANLFQAIRQLIEPPPPETKREIGFHVRETAPRYRTRKMKEKV
jgi:hypothetical protein